MTELKENDESQRPVFPLHRLVGPLRAYRPLDDFGQGVHHTICDEAADALESACKRAEYWKAELLEANKEIERLRGLIDVSTGD